MNNTKKKILEAFTKEFCNIWGDIDERHQAYKFEDFLSQSLDEYGEAVSEEVIKKIIYSLELAGEKAWELYENLKKNGAAGGKSKFDVGGGGDGSKR